MNLRKAIALGWLVVTILPIIYVPFSFIMTSSGMQGASPEDFRSEFDTLFRMHTFVIAMTWVLIASYVIYMYRTSYVPKSKRNLWLAVLIFANMFALPFFWFYYVWQPATQPSASPDEIQSASKSKVPLIIGVLLVMLIPITSLIPSFQISRSYSYLWQAFPVSSSEKQQIPAGSISISRPLGTHGMIGLDNGMTVLTTDQSVAIEPSFPDSMFYSAFEIPGTAVHSCSRQCGGGKDYILILEDLETEIRIEDASDLMDWCWDNQIPILSSNSRREWLYNGTNLPTLADLGESLVSRSAFDEKAKRACQGY